MEDIIKQQTGFKAGDILVVPKSSFLSRPAFFKVIATAARNHVYLSALGTRHAAGKCGFEPDSSAYHTSYCPVEQKTSRWTDKKTEVVSTWCGDAVIWDGVPC